MTIEISTLNSWSAEGALTIRGREPRKGWPKGQVIVLVKPGETRVIKGPGLPNLGGISLMVACNENDDGGEITCFVSGGKIERRWCGIEISFDPRQLSQRLEAGHYEIVSIGQMPIAEIQHIPRTPRRRWDSLKRRIGI